MHQSEFAFDSQPRQLSIALIEPLESRRLMSAASVVTIHSVLLSNPPAAVSAPLATKHPPHHKAHHPAPKPKKHTVAKKTPVVTPPTTSPTATDSGTDPTSSTPTGSGNSSTTATSSGSPVTSAPPTTTANPGPTPPVPGSWQTTFDDEFDGTTLNPVWHTAQYWDHAVTIVNKGELQAYDASGVTVSGGQLHLAARVDNQYGVPYVSGIVQAGGDIYGNPAQKTFSFQYGYMEVRAKMPKGQGFAPAIWMMPASHNDGDGEIDVVEVLGHDPTQAYFTVHHLALNTYQQHTEIGADLSAGFHTYGVDWEPDHITWYLDGVAVGTVTDQSLIPHEPMYPIMNLTVGGDWEGPPNASTKFPASMDVDYIHVWQADAA